MTEHIAAKRLKITPPLIGTHNGHFHADEALAVYLLRLLPAYNPSNLVRTRDPALLSTCHTVVDVGGEYAPETNRYDHHQRTFDATFPSHATKLSSAGLIYLHFGKAIIAQRLSLPESDSDVGLLHEKLYDDYVEALDANDNGISVYDSADTAKLNKRFKDSGVTLGSLVSDLNHDWSESSPLNDKVKDKGTPEQVQEEEDRRFLEASRLMGTSFLRKLDDYYYAWLPARNLVYRAYEKRQEYDEKGRILVLEKGAPWKDHLYTLEAEHASQGKVLYVLYPETPREDSKWRIQAVSVEKDSFESRKALPEAWKGVRDEALDGVTGIEGCVFVHASGFIGGNKTFKGALMMAQKSVEI